MNPTAHIFNSMVNNLMPVSCGKPLIGSKCISIDGRALLDTLCNFIVKDFLAPTGNTPSPHFPAAL